MTPKQQTTLDYIRAQCEAGGTHAITEVADGYASKVYIDIKPRRSGDEFVFLTVGPRGGMRVDVAHCGGMRKYHGVEAAMSVLRWTVNFRTEREKMCSLSSAIA